MSAGQILVVGGDRVRRRGVPELADAARHGRAAAVRMATHGRGRGHEAAPHSEPVDGAREARRGRRRRAGPQRRLGRLVRRPHHHARCRPRRRSRVRRPRRRRIGSAAPTAATERRRPRRRRLPVPATVAPLRTPTPTSRSLSWVGGDSMAAEVGESLVRVAGETGVITPTLDARISTGLDAARLLRLAAAPHRHREPAEPRSHGRDVRRERRAAHEARRQRL